jgi:hypothetical protein
MTALNSHADVRVDAGLGSHIELVCAECEVSFIGLK